jgi:hypothetical protein
LREGGRKSQLPPLQVLDQNSEEAKVRDDAILVKELAIIRTLWFPCEEVARVHRGLVDQLQDGQLRAYACSDISRSVDDIRPVAVSWHRSWTTAATISRPSTKGIFADYSKRTTQVENKDVSKQAKSQNAQQENAAKPISEIPRFECMKERRVVALRPSDGEDL